MIGHLLIVVFELGLQLADFFVMVFGLADLDEGLLLFIQLFGGLVDVVF